MSAPVKCAGRPSDQSNLFGDECHYHPAAPRLNWKWFTVCDLKESFLLSMPPIQVGVCRPFAPGSFLFARPARSCAKVAQGRPVRRFGRWVVPQQRLANATAPSDPHRLGFLQNSAARTVLNLTCGGRQAATINSCRLETCLPELAEQKVRPQCRTQVKVQNTYTVRPPKFQQLRYMPSCWRAQFARIT